MNPEKGKVAANIIRSQNRFLRGLIVLLGIGACFQTLLILYLVSRDTTKIVPAVVTRPYEIGGYGVNPEYLSDMADYILTRLFTVNPNNVEYNTDSVLKIVDPSNYAVLKTTLDTSVDRIKKENISMVWSGSSSDVSPSENLVFVRGKLSTYITDKLVSETPKEYAVTFIFKSAGRLYVSSIREVIRSSEGHVIEYK